MVPESVTTFVGRDYELRDIRALLDRDDVRLVTLIGPGGVGKTRLASRVGTEVATSDARRVWFVSLVAVHDPALVLPVIARTVGLRESGDRLVGEMLVEFLESQEVLLILDNFERVLDAGPAVTELLAACPALTVLVTSRIVLSVSGEHVYTVPPLALPPKGHALASDRAEDAEAVRLFVDRAAASSSGFALTDANAATVAEICRRLDGLPLALELAAARMASLSPAALLSLLQHRLTLLTHGVRDAPPRHRSMREAIAWSHDLLTAEEQLAFRYLSIFSAGFSLAAAQAVLPRIDVIDVIDSLVAKSLLVPRVGGDDGDIRYYMLETLREFASEQLTGTGEMATARERHAEHFQAVARASEWGWFLPAEEGATTLRRLEDAHADMIAALGWLWESGDGAALLDFAGSLTGLWCVCGHVAEGQVWLERALATDLEADLVTRAQALGTLSFVVVLRGQPGRAFELAEQGNALLRSEPPTSVKAFCLAEAGMAARQLGAFDVAISRQRTAMAVMEHLDDATLTPEIARNWIASLEVGLGRSAMMQGDVERAEGHFIRAHDRQLARGYAPGASHIFGSHILAGLGDAARAQGRSEEALQHYRASLEPAWQSRDLLAIAHAIGGIAGSLAAVGRQGAAAMLFGASEAIHDTYGYRFDMETLDRQRALGLPEPWARGDDPCGVWQALRDALRERPLPSPIADPDATAEQWARGRRLPLDAAVSEALSVRVDVPSTPVRSTSGLSSRELEVLRLLVEGRKDSEIASALFISQRTVATHIRHIYDKLGVSSRAAAAAHAVRHGLA